MNLQWINLLFDNFLQIYLYIWALIVTKNVQENIVLNKIM